MTGDETPRTEKTEQEIRALLDNVIERIVNTCTRLSVCAYTTDDSVEDVEHKLRETKVCSRFGAKKGLKTAFFSSLPWGYYFREGTKGYVLENGREGTLFAPSKTSFWLINLNRVIIFAKAFRNCF